VTPNEVFAKLTKLAKITKEHLVFVDFAAFAFFAIELVGRELCRSY
jgi:hypothetical protein